MIKYLIFFMSLLFSSCMMTQVITDRAWYEKDITHEPRCKQLIGKCFSLKKEVYLYAISNGSTEGCACSISKFPVCETIFEKDGSTTEISSTSSCRIVEKIYKGKHLRVVKITTRCPLLGQHREYVYSIYVEFQNCSGKILTVSAEDLFAYPYDRLQPNPEYLEEIPEFNLLQRK